MSPPLGLFVITYIFIQDAAVPANTCRLAGTYKGLFLKTIRIRKHLAHKHLIRALKENRISTNSERDCLTISRHKAQSL